MVIETKGIYKGKYNYVSEDAKLIKSFNYLHTAIKQKKFTILWAIVWLKHTFINKISSNRIYILNYKSTIFSNSAKIQNETTSPPIIKIEIVLNVHYDI